MRSATLGFTFSDFFYPRQRRSMSDPVARNSRTTCRLFAPALPIADAKCEVAFEEKVQNVGILLCGILIVNRPGFFGDRFGWAPPRSRGLLACHRIGSQPELDSNPVSGADGRRPGIESDLEPRCRLTFARSDLSRCPALRAGGSHVLDPKVQLGLVLVVSATA